jgi:hypothetical protein
MAELESHHDPRQHLSILRHHVLGPVLTAESLTERVRTEVANERDAFEAFADRIATITVDSPRPPALMAGSVDTSVESSAAALLRDGFEATVMAVPHYDDVYGESVEEHASAEFGPDLASLLSSKTSTTFTQSHRKLLVGAAKQRARDRDEFCDRLDSELHSLGSRRHDITTILDNFDTSIVPTWYRDQFEEELRQVLQTRQSTLGAQSSISYVDEHSLCAYLYAEESWTYPVLTAVARLLDSISVPE